MDWALSHYVLLGVTTNIPFLRAVINHAQFRRGEATTDFVERHFAGWQPAARLALPAETAPESAAPDLALAAAALSELLEGALGGATPVAVGGATQGDPYSPWRQSTGFRPGA
jgi:acetyl/propionyl-CoA carboxylase alpha subunit